MAFKTQDDVVRWYKNFDSANSYQKSDEEVYNLDKTHFNRISKGIC